MTAAILISPKLHTEPDGELLLRDGLRLEADQQERNVQRSWACKIREERCERVLSRTRESTNRSTSN